MDKLVSHSEPFGLRLRLVLGLNGVSAYRIGKDTNDNPSATIVYSWFEGKVQPRAETLIKLLNRYDITEDQILFLWGRRDISASVEDICRAFNRDKMDVSRATYKAVRITEEVKI